MLIRVRATANFWRIGPYFHGTVIEQVLAPFDGEVLYIIGTPPLTKGEPVAMIGYRRTSAAR